MTGKSLTRICAFLLMITTILIYYGGLGGGFLFDDYPSIVDNTALHIDKADAASLQRAAFSFEPGGGGRPLSMVTFGLNHVVGGLAPYNYKLTGLAVHTFNALLVFWLCVQLLMLTGFQGRRARLSAFAIACAWSIHPIQASTVLYVVQRMETLSLTFVLLALLAYIKGRTLQTTGERAWPWLFSCVPLVILGLAAKETALLFPVYALALELTFLRFGAADARFVRAWRMSYVIATLVATTIFCFVIWPAYTTPDAYLTRDFTAGERLLTQLRVLPLYLTQIALPIPSNLTFYYDDYVASRSLLSPFSTLIGAAFLLILLGIAFVLRTRARLAALGLMWFFSAHLLTSNVLALELVFEHRNYFALLGILLVATDVVARITPRDGQSIKIAGVATILLGLGVLCAIRAAMWGDDLLLATDLAASNPSSPRAAHDLGVIYYGMSDGDTDGPFHYFAESQFERESQLPAASILGDQALILMAASANKPAKAEWWDRLLLKLTTRPITPETTHAMFALLHNRREGHPVDDTRLLEAFHVMLGRVRLPAYSYADIGDYAMNEGGNSAVGTAYFVRAIELSADEPTYAVHVVQTLEAKGHLSQAAAAREAAAAHGIAVPDAAPGKEVE